MNLLALDTSTEACSVALRRADGEIFAEFEIAPRRHMALLPQMLQRVLAAAELDKRELTHCAFTNGPGAFTGIRIAAAQAQGIGLALGIPLLPLSTLAVLAQTAFEQHRGDRVLVGLDARMQEIYWAIYQRDADGRARLVDQERLSDAANVVIDDGIDFGAGHGWTEALSPRAKFPLLPGLMPEARALLSLAAAQADNAIDPGRIEINYLRNKVAEKAGGK